MAGAPGPGGGASGPGSGESVLLVAIAAVAMVGAWFWLASEVAGLVATGRWPHLPVSHLVAALRRFPHVARDPLEAWAPSGRPGRPSGVPAILAFYTTAVAVLAAAAAGAGRMRSGYRPPTGARWAGRTDLRVITVGSRRRGPRLVLGRPVGGGPTGRLVATEARHSVLVIGPTQSGKTTGLAIPAILEWAGPVLATSVKDDLAAVTVRWRASRGPCRVFDPTCSTGLTGTDPAGDPLRARWSPLSASGSWSDAQKMAGWLVESTPGRSGMADAAFWYTTAAKQLAPLLLAAQRGGLSMAEVVRWTDTQDYGEPMALLQIAGDDQAAVALAACAERDERIRSSVSTTLETVLAPFADPVVAAATSGTDLSTADLLEQRGTLYLCGPTHEQHRVQGLFAALVSTVVADAVRRASARGRPLDPPLLLVLDEAANIAPIRDLDTLASTGAGLGIQLVTVCQDLSQLAARYDPERARTIANNHRAKLLLSGVGDPQTLDLISGLAGEQAVREQTVTHDLRSGGRTRTEATVLRRLAPSDQLRRVEPGQGVLVYGHLPPVRLRLRPWYRDRTLRRRAAVPGGRGA